MALTYSTIELTNQYAEYKNEEKLVQPNKIRRWSGEFMIDTSAIRMAIIEEIREKLSLRKETFMNAALADGSIRQVDKMVQAACSSSVIHPAYRTFIRKDNFYRQLLHSSRHFIFIL